MFRIGIVGTGIIAAQHKNAILKNADSELVCVCDIDRSKAEKCAEGINAAIYTDYREMAQNEKIDAVIINLPHFLHKEAVIYFLERKINVLVEKPMAISASECEQMKAAAEKNGMILAVGHIQRYLPAHRELKKIIDNKILGELCVVTETRNIDYFVDTRPSWFLDKDLAGGGIIMNYGAHTLDKLLYLVDSKIKSVNANIGNILNDKNIEAQAQILLGFENNVSAALSYCASRINYIYETYFFFTDGVAKIEDGRYLWTSVKDVPFKKAELNYDVVPIELQYEEFVKWLKGEKADIADADFGKRTLEVIDRVYGRE